jgi:hypothetical protein
MLLPYLPVLNNKKIILGSQSKSRKMLVTAQVKLISKLGSQILMLFKQIC